MKRVFTVWLCVLLCVALTACKEAPVQTAPPAADSPQEPSFRAVVVDVQPNASSPAWVVVEPLEGEDELRSADRIDVSLTALEAPFLRYGDAVRITYNGEIAESYPAQAKADAIEILTDVRDVPFPLTWVTKGASEEADTFLNDVVITAAFEDCFFAELVIPHIYNIKVNAPLPDGWCIGDQVELTMTEVYEDEDHRIEGNLSSITESTFVIDPNACYKPVIYLYPETEQEVSVTLDLRGELTCTYPAYHDGWHVTAAPDGTLTDRTGQTYNYLYWEGDVTAAWDVSEGFCIKGEDTAAFLETALASLGLTRREANEFIVYWLPLMQDNPYNLITFQTDAYEEAAALHVTPTPDTVIRVFMTYKALDTAIDIPPQTLTAPAREGFTVVEWGGTKGQ